MARSNALVAQGVPSQLGLRLAALPDLVAAPDIVLAAERTGRPVEEIAATHFAVENLFGLGSLAGAARAVPVSDPAQFRIRVGLDIASVDRVARVVTKYPAAQERLFTTRERDYCRSSDIQIWICVAS